MEFSLAHSHVRGGVQPPLIELTIGQALDATARRLPDATALISRHQGISWTWSEFISRVNETAAGLLALGLKQGERVGIWAPNCAEWAIIQFATAKAGLILVNINPAYRTSEVEYALNKVECAAIVTAPSHKGSDFLAMLRELGPARLPRLRLLATTVEEEHDGFLPFSALRSRDTDRLMGLKIDSNDPVNIQFTSGTTGHPKGAMLSHRNILNNGFFVGERIGLNESDRLCLPVPLYHCFGMVMGNLACVTHGSAIVYPSAAFDPLATLQAVDEARCSALYGVPTMFIAMLNRPEFNNFDLSTLRTGIMAGSPCPVTVMQQVINRMHMDEVTIAYGMTETSPVSFQSDSDDPIDVRVSTVGRVQPHLEAKVVGPDGITLPCGETGELCTRGYSVMLGYWEDSDQTAEAIDGEGWMYTGDLATIDEGGYCRIVGRIKDMVIRGGENIYPREIEEFLLSHPEIIDVQVIGVPDEHYGEELCAWIILHKDSKLGVADIQSFCSGRIAHYKIPKHIRFVDAFPMTVTGKVQKFIMRQMMMERPPNY